jgi:hypothetical protein
MGTAYSPSPASRVSRFLTCLRQREGTVLPALAFLVYGE